MRILLCSYWFAPSIGGVESSSKVLAEEFAKAGASVTVVTNSSGPEFDGPYAVVRQPSQAALLGRGRDCDVIFQNLISLRSLVPLLLCGKPVVIAHASWMRRTDGSRGLENYLKLLATRCATNVAISESIARDLPAGSEVIGNPFEAREFAQAGAVPRDRDIVFMGRLVSDKGVDLLLRAIGLLKGQGIAPTVTIVGDGPEMGALQALASELKIDDRVAFLGAVREGRGEIVARHRIMAIPSRWAEPFGIVGLEGIAAGCAIAASAGGGLAEAVGPCGLLFPNGDAAALAGSLRRLLTEPALRESLAAHGPEHLKAFQPETVAKRYLELFQRVVAR